MADRRQRNEPGEPSRPTEPSGIQDALADPGNAAFAGVVTIFVLGSAALLQMDVSGSGAEGRQWENFQLAVGAVAFMLVTGLIVRVWTHPIRKRRAMGVGTGVRDQLFGECRAMIAYALERGLPVVTTDLAAVEGKDNQGDELDDIASIVALNEAHRRLTTTVYPAMPKTLHLLRRSETPAVLGWLGPVRLVRMLMGLAVTLVVLFVVLGLSIGVTAESTNIQFFGGNFVERTRVGLYLVTSAALGSTFAGLTKAFRYIGNLSYDDKYESSYWIRLILGVVSGLILSIVLSQVFFNNQTTETTGFRITVPLLAVVGGFSSDLVYNLLRRVIDALETLVSGSASERVEAAVAEAESRNRAAGLSEKTVVARRLIAIRELVPADAEDAIRSVDLALAEVLGETFVDIPAVEKSGRTETAQPKGLDLRTSEGESGAGDGSAEDSQVGPATAPHS